MKYYYFSGGDHTANNKISILEEHGFTGVLFTYNALSGDYFTLVARDIDLSQKIVYMVAIRPHTISPQYLSMISNSIHGIMPNRLQINLISGHIKKEEKNVGGVLGVITDQSTHIERSNYLIEYLQELDKMYKAKACDNMPDIFVSTTNEYVFETASSLKNKMIIKNIVLTLCI